MITIYIPGTPTPQGRPKFARRGDFVTTYDPQKSRDYKSWVKSCAVDTMQKGGSQMIAWDVPLALHLHIILPRPKTLPKRFNYPTKKPDCSNILKGIELSLIHI